MAERVRPQNQTKNDYIRWLAVIVGMKNEIDLHIIEALYNIEFVYHMDGDDNRAMDGLSLREEFEDEFGMIMDVEDNCTFLEFLIGMAKRCDYILWDHTVGPQINVHFQRFLMNLGIEPDDAFEEIVRKVHFSMDRKYDNLGRGHIFPLKERCRNYTKMELWYQMSRYLEENWQ